MTHFSSATSPNPNAEREMGAALRASIERCRPTFEGQNVLVTGASGFLGGHLVRALQEVGAMVNGDISASAVSEGDFSFVFDLENSLDPTIVAPLVIHTSDDISRGLNSIGLRLCSIFGPDDFNFDAVGNVIARAMRNILRDGESPEMSMSAMDEFRDYIYVEDAVRALLHLAHFPNCRGRGYELPGTHYGATADVLREIVAQVSALQDEMILVEPRSALAQHHWNRSIRIVPSKANSEAQSTPRSDGSGLWRDAGFEPETSFRAGLQLTAQFYATHFAGSLSAKPRFIPAVPHHHQRAEPAFETVYTDDGLPVHVLNPHAHVRDKGAPRPQDRRPRSFVVESVLMAI